MPLYKVVDGKRVAMTAAEEAEFTAPRPQAAPAVPAITQLTPSEFIEAILAGLSSKGALPTDKVIPVRDDALQRLKR